MRRVMDRVEVFTRQHPFLHHVAGEEAWPLIERLGLLSTAALLEHFGVDEHERARISAIRRTGCYPLANAAGQRAVIRDQIPLQLATLQRCLDFDCSVEEWRRLLDARVFLFASETDARGLMNARRNRGRKQCLIRIDRRLLIEVCGESVEVADINTGTTVRRAPGRGRRTFQKIFTYSPVGKRSIKEVTVLDRVQDINRFLPSISFHTG